VTFSIRAATAARALGIYFLVLVCSLAAAALLLVEAAIEAPSVKPDADAQITFMADVDAVSPKLPGRNLLSEASSSAVAQDGRQLTVQATAVLPPRDQLIGNGEAAPERLLPQRAAVWNANRSTLDGYPISRDLRPQSGTVSDGLIATQQDTLDQTSAAATPIFQGTERKTRRNSSYASQPASRRRLPRAPPPGALAGTAPPISPGLVGAGCPPGSDPRWSGPDGAGAPVLICNPYYRRVAVQTY
jgi:hypothetical protein